VPSTKQIARWLQLNANGWNIEGVKGIVPLINEAQNILMQTESEQTLVRDTATGNFPSFETESGVFEYEMPANIWRVSQVLLDVQNTLPLNIPPNSEYGITPTMIPPTQRVMYAGREYVRVLYINTRDRTMQEPCRVRFSTDPTAQASVYLYRGYELPTQITSAGIDPSLPDSNGLHMRTLLPAAAKLIEAFQNNTWDEALDYINKELRPIVRKEMNSGEQSLEHSTTRLDF